MPPTSSNAANLATLRRLSERLKARAAPAVRAGQALLAAGMRKRCPVATGRLRRSIAATKVGASREFVGGYVVASAHYAAAAEANHPFANPTARHDGPRARDAMARALLGGS